jgi:hypothetical protein
MTTTLPEAVKKREYRNNTAGWIGVVILDHNGQEQGVNIEPHGTIWLSDAEAILTARAPRNPADNPFEERVFIMQEASTGQRREVKMRPVVLASDKSREMYGSERYVPGITEQTERALTERAAHEGAPVALSPQALAREQAVLATAHQTEQAVGPSAALGEQSELDQELLAELRSFTPAPQAPGEVLHAPLAGEDNADTQEEHAALVDPQVGEETGRAPAPASPAPAGEYARAEEVGSPAAPTRPSAAGR